MMKGTVRGCICPTLDLLTILIQVGCQAATVSRYATILVVKKYFIFIQGSQTHQVGATFRCLALSQQRVDPMPFYHGHHLVGTLV